MTKYIHFLRFCPQLCKDYHLQRAKQQVPAKNTDHTQSEAIPGELCLTFCEQRLFTQHRWARSNVRLQIVFGQHGVVKRHSAYPAMRWAQNIFWKDWRHFQLKAFTGLDFNVFASKLVCLDVLENWEDPKYQGPFRRKIFLGQSEHLEHRVLGIRILSGVSLFAIRRRKRHQSGSLLVGYSSTSSSTIGLRPHKDGLLHGSSIQGGLHALQGPGKLSPCLKLFSLGSTLQNCQNQFRKKTNQSQCSRPPAWTTAGQSCPSFSPEHEHYSSVWSQKSSHQGNPTHWEMIFSSFGSSVFARMDRQMWSCNLHVSNLTSLVNKKWFSVIPDPESVQLGSNQFLVPPQTKSVFLSVKVFAKSNFGADVFLTFHREQTQTLFYVLPPELHKNDKKSPMLSLDVTKCTAQTCVKRTAKYDMTIS